jgi:hypothetical protein
MYIHRCGTRVCMYACMCTHAHAHTYIRSGRGWQPREALTIRGGLRMADSRAGQSSMHLLRGVRKPPASPSLCTQKCLTCFFITATYRSASEDTIRLFAENALDRHAGMLEARLHGCLFGAVGACKAKGRSRTYVLTYMQASSAHSWTYTHA